MISIAQTSDLEACLNLRRIVFMQEQSVSEAEEHDGQDADAIHMLALDGDVPVGTARALLKGNVGKIGRVCVLQSHRGTGLGTQIMQATLQRLANEPDIDTARLGAQTHALGFYEKLGFVAFGDEFLDAGIPHYKMERTV